MFASTEGNYVTAFTLESQGCLSIALPMLLSSEGPGDPEAIDPPLLAGLDRSRQRKPRQPVHRDKVLPEQQAAAAVPDSASRWDQAPAALLLTHPQRRQPYC